MKKNKSKFPMISLVLSIISLVLLFTIIFPIVAIVTAVIAYKKEKSKLTIASIIISLIAVICGIGILFISSADTTPVQIAAYNKKVESYNKPAVLANKTQVKQVVTKTNALAYTYNDGHAAKMHPNAIVVDVETLPTKDQVKAIANEIRHKIPIKQRKNLTIVVHVKGDEYGEHSSTIMYIPDSPFGKYRKMTQYNGNVLPFDEQAY